jgi:lipocalin-like protein
LHFKLQKQIAMKLVSLLPILVLIGLAPAVFSQNKSPAQPRHSGLEKQLIGTWRIVVFEDRKDEKDPNSEWTYPYGKNPKGYFVYDETGHVTIQIMRAPPPAKFASGDDKKPTLDEAKAAYEGYVAYFGTYTIDEASHSVIHHVEGSLGPSYIGTDQKRPFELSGDRLIIGDQKTWRRVLERVR